MTFEEAEEFMRECDRKKIDRNTEMVRRDADSFSVLHHGYEVVRIHRLGLWRVGCGGWHSVSTARRIVRFSPASVCVRRGVMYLRSNGDLLSLEYVRRVVDASGNLSQSGSVLMRD